MSEYFVEFYFCALNWQITPLYFFKKKVRTLLKFLANLKQTKYMFKVSLLHM